MSTQTLSLEQRAEIESLAEQHDRAAAAWLLVQHDIADGRKPIERLIVTSFACDCRPCIDGSVEQARELGDWIRPTAIERFVAQCCELSPSASAKPAELLAAYRGWAHGAGEDTTVTGVKLGRELAARVGVRSQVSHSQRTYRGIGLRR
ncbi:MAG: hypothetical protein WBB07_15560 [Mycobacterium sp.]